jgi:positive regulator of sigma E activity
LIFLIAGLMLGSALSQGRESIMLLYGFLLLALSLIIVKIADVTLGKKAGWHPDIVEVNPEIEQEDSFICAEMKKR